MNRNRCAVVALAALTLSGWCSTTVLAAPWDGLLTVSRVEADPDKSYPLAEENGPWMIMACSFSGPGAAEQARELVLELRGRYKLPAYVFQKNFDHAKGAVRHGVDPTGRPLPVRFRGGNESHEIAVLVGNYQSIDDPKAQATLEKIRHCRPKCLEVDVNRRTARNLAGYRLLTKLSNDEKVKRGPMAYAFITTNPVLPKEYFVPRGIDQFVQSINADCEFSLLDCPGQYTVQVAHFTGKVEMEQEKIRQLENRGGLLNPFGGLGEAGSELHKAGEAAERLTKALRIKGYEAYVFHDRYASIVTVGSFNSVGTPRADGKIEINPQIHSIIQNFAVGSAPVIGGAPPGTTTCKALVGIPFDPQPIVVRVPKRSITAAYSRQAAGLW